MKIALAIFLIVLCQGEVFFSEEFGRDWTQRWVQSSNEGTEKFVVSAGSWNVNEAQDKGLKTTVNLKHYQISSRFPTFTHKGKPLIIQFTVKNEQVLDCGGGYVNILPEGFDQEYFSGETPYLVMFGPDSCGNERKTHVLLPYNGKNYINNRKFRNEFDNLTHQYTLVLNPDNTFEVLIDNDEIASGKIEDYFDILPPKEIQDPSAKKPSDWVDSPTITDPNDVKPEGWDSIPNFIPDPDAKRPDDWDDEYDGEWKAPKIRNPEYKGEWKAKTIPNPNYKGAWKANNIPNPEYKRDDDLYLVKNAGGIGIEIWQVTAGTIFDNIFIGDSKEEAREFSDRTFKYRKEQEPAILEAYDRAKAPPPPSDYQYEEVDDRNYGKVEFHEEEFEEYRDDL